jgi:hypothetical protein
MYLLSMLKSPTHTCSHAWLDGFFSMSLTIRRTNPLTPARPSRTKNRQSHTQYLHAEETGQKVPSPWFWHGLGHPSRGDPLARGHAKTGTWSEENQCPPLTDRPNITIYYSNATLAQLETFSGQGLAGDCHAAPCTRGPALHGMLQVLQLTSVWTKHTMLPAHLAVSGRSHVGTALRGASEPSVPSLFSLD